MHYYRYITLEDMKGLLGTAEGSDDEALSKMWEDAMVECVCPLGKISYDDFRMFIKGQRREKEPASPIPRRSSKRLVLDASPLQAVPEGSTSPQAKHQVFGKFEHMSALESLALPELGAPRLTPAAPDVVRDEKVNIGFPGDLSKPIHVRGRSRSLGENLVRDDYLWRDQTDEEPENQIRRSSATVLPSKAICDLQYVIHSQDESKTTLEVHKALYRKHREFRQSVMQASKLFDQKRKASKFKLAQISPDNCADHPQKRASLVMRRGVAPLKAEKSITASSDHLSSSLRETQQPAPNPTPVEALPDNIDQGKLVADAARRGGRPRRPRQRTTSDISGMLR